MYEMTKRPLNLVFKCYMKYLSKVSKVFYDTLYTKILAYFSKKKNFLTKSHFESDFGISDDESYDGYTIDSWES